MKDREAEKDSIDTSNNKEISDANKCIGIGAGVGALGAGTTILTGLSCPICWIAAPALVGIGVVQRIKSKKKSIK